MIVSRAESVGGALSDGDAWGRQRPPAGGRWIVGGDPPSTEAKLRLFCFAHAGGGAAFFFPWRRALAPDIDVRPILLPGRESRAREQPHRRIEQLLDPLCDALGACLELPYVLFGHSTGAVIAYEAARRLSAGGLRSPSALLVSGRRAPGLTSSRPAYSEMSHQELLAALKDLNGTPDVLLEHPALLEAMLPTLRADLEINEHYRPLAGPALTCPVVAYLGTADRHVDHSELVAWHGRTSGRFIARTFEGDHFYLKGDRPDVMRALAEDLALAS